MTLAALRREPVTTVLRLGELADDAVDTLVRTRLPQLDADAAGRVAGVLATRSGGHALHLTTLLDVLADQPDEQACRDAAAEIPARLRPLLDHQVASLPATCRRVVEALAVLRPIALPDLAAVLDDDPVAVLTVLRPAVDGGLVVAGRDDADDGLLTVRHDLLADAVADTVPRATRAQLHRARLTLLPGDVDPFVRLRHTLGASVLVPASDRALARWEAGRSAYGRRAVTEALALLDAAAADLPPEHAADLAVHRGLALSALRRTDEANDALDDTLDAIAAEPDPAARTLAALAAIGDEPLGTAVTGDVRRLARLHRVRALVLPDRARFEVLVALIREEGALQGLLPADLLEETITLGRGLAASDRVAAARVRALDARSLVDAPAPALRRLQVATEAYELAHAIDDPMAVLDATELLMSAALAAGRPERARELRAVLARDAEGWRRPRLQWAADVVGVALTLCDGDFDAADAAALAALTHGRELGLADALPAYGVHLLIRHLLTGTAAAVSDLAIRAAASARNTAAWTAAAAFTESQAGRRDTARSYLAEFRRRRAEGDGLWFDRPGLCLAALAACDLGDEETARLVREAVPADEDAVVLVGYGAAVIGPVPLFTGLASWTLGDDDTAREHFAAATRATEAMGWTPWAQAARALRDAVDDPSVPLPLGLRRPAG